MLVVTADRGIADRWFTHVVSNCRRFHAVIKGLDEDKYDESTAKDDEEALRKSCFTILKRSLSVDADADAAGFNSNDDDDDDDSDFTIKLDQATGKKTIIEADGKEFSTSFDFFGICWTHRFREIIMKDDDTQDYIEQFISGMGWIGTRRELAGILGKSMWYRRVHGLKNYNADELQTKALLGIYSLITPIINESREWDTPLADPKVTIPFIEGLLSAWEQRWTVRQAKNEGFEVEFDLTKNVMFAASDASTSEECIASFIYHPLDLTTPPTIEQEKFSGKIAVAEMAAIELCIRGAIAKNPDVELIVLGTDNMNCKHWIERGCSHREEVNVIMRRIYWLLNPAENPERHENNNNNDNNNDDDSDDHLHGAEDSKIRKTRLFVTFIPTLENVADGPSRKKAWSMEQWIQTNERLEMAFAEAKGIWGMIGGLHGTSKEN
jgi:hypothetical protein